MRGNVPEAQQSAQLPAIKEVLTEYRGIHLQVLQDLMTRLDKAFQAFFRRLRERHTPVIPASRETIAIPVSPQGGAGVGARQ
jgi:putative transposase